MPGGKLYLLKIPYKYTVNSHLQLKSLTLSPQLAIKSSRSGLRPSLFFSRNPATWLKQWKNGEDYIKLKWRKLNARHKTKRFAWQYWSTEWHDLLADFWMTFDSLTDWLTDRLTDPPTRPTDHLTDHQLDQPTLLADWLTDWLTDKLKRWMTIFIPSNQLTHRVTDPAADWEIDQTIWMNNWANSVKNETHRAKPTDLTQQLNSQWAG